MKKQSLDQFLSNSEVEVMGKTTQAELQGGFGVDILWDFIKSLEESRIKMFETLAQTISTDTTHHPTGAPLTTPTYHKIDSVKMPDGTMLYGVPVRFK